MAELDEWIATLDDLVAVFTTEGLTPMAELAARLPMTEYVEAYPLSQLRLPPQDLDAVLPEGLEPADLGPYWDSFLDMEESGDYSRLDVPSGLDQRELVAFFEKFQLVLDSQARSNGAIKKSVAFTKAYFEASGELINPIVVHEDGRVILGLEACWALEEMEVDRPVRVVILRGAPRSAGAMYKIHSDVVRAQETWNLEDRKQGFESATLEVQDFFLNQGADWSSGHAVLTCTEATLDKLGVLVRKQLGTKGKLDPAQLLYVESLREAVLDMRQGLIRDGRTEGDVVSKLAVHLKEEKDALARGAKIEAKNGWRWDVDDDGLFFHPALKRYRFKIVEPAPLVAAPERTYQVDQTRLMSAEQFRLLTLTHFGLDSDEAANCYEQLSDDEFNDHLRAYVSRAPEVAPKVRGLPTDEEQIKQAERLALFDAGA